MATVISSAQEMASIARQLRMAGNTIGFVPTMGALHEGHMSLVQRSIRDNDVTVVSIFVNPTQFTAGEDFERYPRDLDRDLELLDPEGVDFVFAPSSDEMYPNAMTCWVEVGGDIMNTMDALSRPHHFRGVATVCLKLFHIVQPDYAYFGQKDFQQVTVIKRLVKDLNIPLEIVMMPIVRENDGLARSSRNIYLKPEQRPIALSLSSALQLGKGVIEQGEHDANKVLQIMGEHIENSGAEIDYIVVADPESLDDKTDLDGPVLLAVAAVVGNVRLIDNLLVNTDQII